MLVSGGVPYKNKVEKRILYRTLRKELGSKCNIWAEDKMVMYQCSTKRDKLYM